MDTSAFLKKSGVRFRAHSVQHLLEQLISVYKRRQQGEELSLPSVCLQLSSGRELVGYVLDMIENEGNGSVIVQTESEANQVRVVYTDLSRIESVALHRAAAKPVAVKQPKLIPLQDSPRAPAAVATKPQPTQIAEVKRPRPQVVSPVAPVEVRSPQTSTAELEKLIISLHSLFSVLFDTNITIYVDWGTIDRRGLGVDAVRTALVQLKQAMSDLATVGSRKEEIRNQITQIKLCHSDSKGVTVDAGTMTFQGLFNQGQSPFKSHIEILSLLESRLF